MELLLTKAPSEYKPAFRREGVLYEIELLSTRPVTTLKAKEKDKDKDKETDAPIIPDLPAASVSPAVAAPMPTYKKLSPLAPEPDDAITWRARLIRYKYLHGLEEEQGDDSFATLKRIVEEIGKQDVSEQQLETALISLAGLFASPHSSVSSFELLQSGLVDALLRLVTDEQRTGEPLCSPSIRGKLKHPVVGPDGRRQLLFRVFTTPNLKGGFYGQSPLATLVKKLQESLTRMESFEVVTVAQSSDGMYR